MDCLHLSSYQQRLSEPVDAGTIAWPEPDAIEELAHAGPVTWTGSEGETRWAVAGGALWQNTGSGWKETLIYPQPPAPAPVVAAAMASPGLWVVAGGALMRFISSSQWGRVTAEDGFPIREVTAVSSAPDGTVAAAGSDGLALLDGGRWRYFAGRRWLPLGEVSRLLCSGSGEVLVETRLVIPPQLVLGAEPSLPTDPADLTEPVGEILVENRLISPEQLHKAGLVQQTTRQSDITRIFVDMGLVSGAVVQRVNDAARGLGGIAVARIARREMTLAEKAAEFERQIAARHNRDGYVTVCFLEDPDNLDSFVHEASDNDGLWTALYIAAESFRFAVTGEPEARELARRSMQALLELERVTPIPGFPARALARKGEPRVVLSKGEWHEAADGERVWKGDTSSDEIVGHYFASAIYHDLVADEGERAEIRETARRITGHIIDHGFLLVDLDGEHTTWGVWSPELLHSPRWAGDRGLNSLEILSHLAVAGRLVGAPRYKEAADTLIREHGYALNTIHQKVTEPGHVNHSDDELAFLSYYPLLRYEADPHLRALYRASLERSWQIERPERHPLWNIIYGALTGAPCDLEAAVATLREIPLDLRHWDVRNSNRPDVKLDPEAGRFQELQSRVPLPADERPMHKWNGNPYRLDGGNGGKTEEDGTFFLLPYWMARYHGLMEEG